MATPHGVHKYGRSSRRRLRVSFAAALEASVFTYHILDSVQARAINSTNPFQLHSNEPRMILCAFYLTPNNCIYLLLTIRIIRASTVSQFISLNPGEAYTLQKNLRWTQLQPARFWFPLARPTDGCLRSLGLGVSPWQWRLGTYVHPKFLSLKQLAHYVTVTK